MSGERYFEDGKNLLRMLQEAEFAQLIVCDELGIGTLSGRKDGTRHVASTYQVANNLGTFGNEKAFFIAIFLQFQRVNPLNLVLCQHFLPIFVAKIRNYS